MGAGTVTAGRKTVWSYSTTLNGSYTDLTHMQGDKSLPDEMLIGTYRPNESTIEQSLPAEIRRRSLSFSLITRRSNAVYAALKGYYRAGTKFYLQHLDAAASAYGEKLSGYISNWSESFPETDPVNVSITFNITSEAAVTAGVTGTEYS